MRLHRPGALHPAGLVDLVNVIVAEHAAAGPEEGVEVLDLVRQFAHFPPASGPTCHLPCPMR